MKRLTWSRILAWFLAVWLIAALAACAGTPPQASGPAAPAATAPAAESPAPALPAVEAPPAAEVPAPAPSAPEAPAPATTVAGTSLPTAEPAAEEPAPQAPAAGTPQTATAPAPAPAEPGSAAADPPPALPEAVATPPAPYPMEVTDDLDRRVVIPAMPRRIVSISPTATEILFAIGAGDRVVAVDDASNYPAAVAGLPRVGSLGKPSLETIVALAPDLVLVSGLSRKVVPDLEAQGLTVVLLNPGNVPAIGRSIILTGRMTGREAAAQVVVAGIAARLDEVGRRIALIPPANRVRVFHEVWHEPLMTAGPGSFIDDLIRRAGGVNILGDAGTAWPTVSLEVVVDRDPQVITTPFQEQFELMQTGARPGWENITAVREQRVYLVDTDLIARAGPRVAEAVEMLARALYPALFTRQE